MSEVEYRKAEETILKIFNDNDLNNIVKATSNNENARIYVLADDIASYVGITHHSINTMISRYYDELSFNHKGRVSSFKITKPNGRPLKHYELDYEQTSFLFTLFRNTPKVVKVKRAITYQFAIQNEILNRRKVSHDLSKEMSKDFSQTIKDQLDNTNNTHVNFNKLVYKYAFGINTNKLKKIKHIPKAKNVVIMDYLNQFEITVLDKAKSHVKSLIELFKDYHVVKKQLEGKCLADDMSNGQYRLY